MSDIKKEEQPKLPWIKSPEGVIDIYTNSVHLTWSKDDVRIRLAQMVDSPETPDPGPTFRGAHQERAAVTFSWRGAKILLDQLSKAVAAYERVNGEIKVAVELPVINPSEE
jgi:hypothetical protein